jgi:phenylpropionate dioxygenase-like ring-hydroxylating dioxygenase large terminal subunit
MLTPEDNERLVRVGPGTPMGTLLRRYWTPALLSAELPENDGPPQRVRLLGEDLIAFRTTDGAVGLVDAFCPHRRAPMFFGRNEECGLRCVYHGWKFAIDGTCVDMPSEPSDSLFKTKVTIGSYPTWEGGGIVWTYMGPRDAMPPAPDYEWTRVPATHRFVSKTFEDANYLQGLEGGFDASHSTFLHNEFVNNKNWVRARAGAPKIEVERTPYGMRIAAIRDLGDEGSYVRISEMAMPAQQMRGMVTLLSGGRSKTPRVDGHLWIPIDDEHTWVYNFLYGLDESVAIGVDQAWEMETFAGRGPDDLIPGTYLPKRNLHNDYAIDRALQKTTTFTGIKGINTQDFAVQEGMGAIVDRSKEHLGTSDRAVITLRQLLLEAVRTVEVGGDPPGIDPESYRTMRAYDDYVPRDADWREHFREALVAKW